MSHEPCKYRARWGGVHRKLLIESFNDIHRSISFFDFYSKILSEDIDKARNRSPEDLQLLSQRSTKVLGLCLQLIYDDGGINVVLVFQESTGPLDLNSPRFHGGLRKVTPIVCNDELGATSHCRSQNVSVFRIVRQLAEQWFVSGYPGIAEVLFQFGYKMRCLVRRQTDFAFQRANHLRDDFLRPSRYVQAWFLSKSQEGVA